jgi:hypothetical protein
MTMPSLAARPLLSSSIENHLQRLIGPDASALMNRPPLEYQARLSQHLRLGHVCIRAGLDTAGTDSLIGRANCLGERVGRGDVRRSGRMAGRIRRGRDLPAGSGTDGGCDGGTRFDDGQRTLRQRANRAQPCQILDSVQPYRHADDGQGPPAAGRELAAPRVGVSAACLPNGSL